MSDCFVTPWILACQAPLSLGFPRQKYWSGLLCPSPGNLPNPGIELASPVSPALQVDSLPLSHQRSLEPFLKSAVILFMRSMKWKLLSCLTLCDLMDYAVRGILQARILEWVAFLFSWGSSQPRDWTQVSCIAGGFFASWVTREAQEYWSG